MKPSYKKVIALALATAFFSTGSFAKGHEYVITSYGNKLIKKGTAWHGRNSGGRHHIYCNDSVRGRTFTTNVTYSKMDQSIHTVYSIDDRGNKRRFCKIGPRDNL